MSTQAILILSILLACSAVAMILFPLRIRMLREWLIRYWEYEQPTREWYTEKWTPNYIRAFGFIYLITAVMLVVVMLRIR